MKFLYLLGFILFNSILFGQGNLQFNQVLSVSDQVQTVPSGKVWKIESYQLQTVSWTTNGTITNCSDLSRPRPYYIDNYPYYKLGGVSTGVANYVFFPQNDFPIWLRAGQTLRTTCPGDFMSILEFNIIP